jgi:hypothetical protein
MIEEDARSNGGFDRIFDYGASLTQYCKQLLACTKTNAAAGQVAPRTLTNEHVPAGISQQGGGKQTTQRSADDQRFRSAHSLDHSFGSISSLNRNVAAAGFRPNTDTIFPAIMGHPSFQIELNQLLGGEDAPRRKSRHDTGILNRTAGLDRKAQCPVVQDTFIRRA